MNHLSDILQKFSFLEEHLVFVDEPLEGFLRSIDSQELFAFRITIVIPDLLWHWILIPVSSSELTIDEIFANAKNVTPERWISIVEDRRCEESHLSMKWLGRSHRLPPRV